VIGDELIAASGMVKLSLVETIDHHLTGVAKGFEHLKSIFIDSVRVEILGDCTVVHIGQFAAFRLGAVEQVLDVNLVDIADFGVGLFFVCSIFESVSDFTCLIVLVLGD
jgi:hypothetical protein